MIEASGRAPMRCMRCGGSGDVPIIAEDSFVYPDRKPLLECCPDCFGYGAIRDTVVFENSGSRQKGRKAR